MVWKRHVKKIQLIHYMTINECSYSVHSALIGGWEPPMEDLPDANPYCRRLGVASTHSVENPIESALRTHINSKSCVLHWMSAGIFDSLTVRVRIGQIFHGYCSSLVPILFRPPSLYEIIDRRSHTVTWTSKGKCKHNEYSTGIIRLILPSINTCKCLLIHLSCNQ